MTLRTTAQEVLDLFNVTSTTKEAFQQWFNAPRKKAVVPVVMAHQSTVIYRLDPEAVERVCRSTEHALGKAKRAIAESVKPIVDWNPNFAFTHTLHFAMEAMGTLPTWQQFMDFAVNDPRGQKMLWHPALKEIHRVSSLPGGPSWAVAKDSMRWRIGNAYYSFLREIYVVTHLRAAGLDVRMHPLADALFRVDFWCGRTVCSLLVKNAKFHKDGQGRKLPVDQILAGANPPFRFHKIQLDRASKFGVVHLPSPEQIRTTAAKLQAELRYNSTTAIYPEHTS